MKGLKMANLTTFQALAQATKDALQELNRLHFVSENTSFEKIYYKLMMQYLNFYQRDTAEEVLTDAWANIFGKKGLKNFRVFSGINPETGEEVAIESYIQMLMGREIINVSKKNKNQYINETHSSEFEGETQEDAFQRDINKQRVSKPKRIDDEYVTVLKEYIKDYQSMIDDIRSGKKQVSNADKIITRLQGKIDNLRKEIKEEIGDQEFIPTEDWDNVYESDYDQESETEFEDLVKTVLKKLPEMERAILVALINGVTRRELAVFFDVETKDINECIEGIVLQIGRLADIMDFDGDDTLRDLLDKCIKNFEYKRDTNKVTKRTALRSMKRALSDKRFSINVNNYFFVDLMQL